MKTLSFLLLVVVIASALVNAANNCTPVSYNGQTWSLNNAQQLMGFFPNVAQTGDITGTWSWVLSMCDPTLVPTGATVCTPPSYVTQVNGPTDPSGCIVYNTEMLGISYNTTVNALEFRYAHPSANLQDTVYCFCSQGTGLQIINNTDLSVQGANFHQIFNVSSPACCPDNGPTVPPPTPTSTIAPNPKDNQCKPVPGPSGQVFALDKPEELLYFNAYMQQTNMAPGQYPMSFSLCNPTLFAPNAVACNPSAFIAQGAGAYAGCNVDFSTMSSVTFNKEIGALQFNYTSTSNNLNWQASVVCTCDRNGRGLNFPTNSFATSQDPEGVIHIQARATSPACCPASTNKCQPVSVNNGQAVIPFDDKTQLQGSFQNINLQFNGENMNTNWQFSLCSTFPDSNAASGQVFITEDASGKNYFGTIKSQPSFDNEAKQVMIEYSGFFNDLKMDLTVYIKCDPFVPTLQIRTNNIIINQDPNTYALKAQVNFVSAAACPRPVGDKK